MCYISGVIVAAPDADACSMPQARRFSRYAVTDDGRPVDEAKTDDDAKALAKEASRTGSEHHEPSRTTRGTVLFLYFGTSPTWQTKARFRKDIPIGSSDQHGRDAGHANRGHPKAVHD